MTHPNFVLEAFRTLRVLDPPNCPKPGAVGSCDLNLVEYGLYELPNVQIGFQEDASIDQSITFL
jgi:hypothetical protein